MRSRLVIVVAVVIAAAVVIFAVSRFVSSPGHGATPASLPTDPASYLGVYEAGALHTYQPVADFTKAVGPAAEPRRVLQRLGGTLPDFVRKDGQQARRGHDLAVGSHSRFGLEDRRCLVTTATCARLRTASASSASRSSSASGTR